MTRILFKTTAALTAALLAHVTGCSSSDDGAGSGGGAISCEAAVQSLPPAPTCDATRKCRGVVAPPDKDACTQCGQAAVQLGLASNALTECSCNHCAVQLAGCFQSASRGEMGGDAARDGKCKTIVECALRTGCAGTDCYCGTGVPLATCLTASATPPTGPCAQQIADGAGCAVADRTCVAQAQLQPDSAVGRAYAVGLCSTGDPTTMTKGNCVAK